MPPITKIKFTANQWVSLTRKGGYGNFCSTLEHYLKGTCPFCVGNGHRNDVNTIILRTGHWVVWEAPAKLRPESHQNGLARHIMIVPIEHREDMTELTDEERSDFWKMFDLICEKFPLTGFMCLGRSGEILLNGGTELHFSFQIKVPDRDMPERARMSEVLVKSPLEEADNEARGQRFLKLYNDGVTPKKFKELVAAGQYTKDGRVKQS